MFSNLVNTENIVYSFSSFFSLEDTLYDTFYMITLLYMIGLSVNLYKITKDRLWLSNFENQESNFSRAHFY